MSFTNTTVANLKLWFKADAGTFTDTAMTTPATADGDAVQGWQDQSTQANHATQSGAGLIPQLKIVTQGGVTYSTIRFASDWLALASALAISGDCTVYAVFKRGTVSTTTIVGGNANSFQAAHTTAIRLVRVGSATVVTGTALLSADALQIGRWKYASSVSDLRMRGTADGTNSASRTWTDFLYIGKVLAASANIFTGDISEILVFDADVSAGDNTIIEQYLFEKYEKPSLLVCDGNSMTANGPSGAGTAHWPSRITSLWDTAEWGYTNIAVSGQTTANMNSDRDAQAGTLINPFRTREVLVCWEGSNHIKGGAAQATVQGDLETYCEGCQTLGYDKVILLTILPRTDYSGGNETDRQTTNTNFRADFDQATSHPRCFLPGAGGTYADLLLDVAAHTDLDDASNATYFADGIHLTSTGYDIIAAEVKSALDVLYPAVGGSVGAGLTRSLKLSRRRLVA